MFRKKGQAPDSEDENQQQPDLQLDSGTTARADSTDITRRKFLSTLGVGGTAAVVAGPSILAPKDANAQQFDPDKWISKSAKENKKEAEDLKEKRTSSNNGRILEKR